MLSEDGLPQKLNTKNARPLCVIFGLPAFFKGLLKEEKLILKFLWWKALSILFLQYSVDVPLLSEFSYSLFHSIARTVTLVENRIIIDATIDYIKKQAG